MRFVRRHIGILVVVGVCASLTSGVAAPAGAQLLRPIGDWTFVSEPVDVAHGGEDYNLHLTARKPDSSGDVTLTVVLSQVRDAAGPAEAMRSLEWTFSIAREGFEHADDLSTGRLRSARRMGRFGEVRLSFAAEGPPRATCGGHGTSRSGKFSGVVSLKTGLEQLGTITVRPTNGTLNASDGMCDEPRAGVVAPPCGRAGVGAAGGEFAIFKPEGGRTFRLSAGWRESLQGLRRAALVHHISATLPAGNADVSRNLRTATVAARHVPWLRGAAHFRASGALLEWPTVTCASGRQVDLAMYRGSWKGDLTARSLLGETVALVKDGQLGSTQRTTTHDTP